MSQDQPLELRLTFESAAGLYQSARPDYPNELFDDLLSLTGISPASDVLEIGCGPGKATLPLAKRGLKITAVELGTDLATEARRNLAGFDDVAVITSSFEEWKPKETREFDLIYAATAWHWIDPGIRYIKAAELLRPGGHLAVWRADHAFPTGYDPFFRIIQQTYEEIGESRPGEWPPIPAEQMPDLAQEFAASGRFEVVGIRRYVWAVEYTANSYIALLDTFSGHIAMTSAKRDRLYGEIRRLLASRPNGRLTRHWSAVVTIGARR